MTSIGKQDQPPEKADLPDSHEESSQRDPQHHPLPLEASKVASSLEEARTLAQKGRSAEALRWLQGILEPLLERPWALQIWFDLSRHLESGKEGEVRGILLKWVQMAETLLRQAAEGTGVADERGVLVTKTLARIYWNQGFWEKALDIYKKLLLKDPKDKALRQEYEDRITALAGGKSARNSALLALESWIHKIQQRRRDE